MVGLITHKTFIEIDKKSIKLNDYIFLFKDNDFVYRKSDSLLFYKTNNEDNWSILIKMEKASESSAEVTLKISGSDPVVLNKNDPADFKKILNSIFKHYYDYSISRLAQELFIKKQILSESEAEALAIKYFYEQNDSIENIYTQ